jgi:hypothetical protein
MLACYRKTWAEVLITGREAARREVYLRVMAAPSVPVPDGFRPGIGGAEWVAHVQCDDPQLRVFDVRWRNYRVNAIAVDRRNGTVPLLNLTHSIGGDDVPGELAKGGWRLVDRGIVAIELPLDAADIHLDETIVKYPGE